MTVFMTKEEFYTVLHKTPCRAQRYIPFSDTGVASYRVDWSIKRDEQITPSQIRSPQSRGQLAEPSQEGAKGTRDDLALEAPSCLSLVSAAWRG